MIPPQKDKNMDLLANLAVISVLISFLHWCRSVLLSKHRLIYVYYKSDSRLQLPLNWFSLYCFFLAAFIARLHWYQASYSGPRASTALMAGSIKSNDNHCCFHVSSGKYNNLPQELMDRIQELIPNASDESNNLPQEMIERLMAMVLYSTQYTSQS
ncbi:hypothetical protein L1987_15456 [Smallanthus sonchifolius]|uniref:Uncharacterized protein n=1 Tax=Smallanthus sonchifolius TaxID=185202 RepID=A0ACB9J651_9ASTR|nr:hypothetical protein L1987_15456 [Smallanthus sonchifolius]